MAAAGDDVVGVAPQSAEKKNRGISIVQNPSVRFTSIIACSPSANKSILQSDQVFAMGWPGTKITGNKFLIAIEGSSHTSIRGLVVKALNQPDALHVINKRKCEGDAARAEYDLLDQLLHLKDDDGKQLQDTEVLDNIVGLIIAGYESTSLSIMWAVYYLAKYPNVLKRLQEEHKNLGRNGDFISRDDIVNLQYTNKHLAISEKF
nr:beta-amyrin 28-monooxygenase-like [Coffea arabica]